MLDAPTPLPAPTGVRRALWGPQLNQALTPQLALRAVGRLDVHACEGPAPRRATCGVLVNTTSIKNCPASRTGPPSLAGSTARLRTNPAPSRAQRRGSSMLLASRSNSLPRRLRVPFETRHESWSDGAFPASSATRLCGRSDLSVIRRVAPPRIVVKCLFIHDQEVTWRRMVCSVRSNDC